MRDTAPKRFQGALVIMSDMLTIIKTSAMVSPLLVVVVPSNSSSTPFVSLLPSKGFRQAKTKVVTSVTDLLHQHYA